MKKTLIALAVLASSGAAMAQSTFTLYGIADVNVERLDGASSVNRISSGGLNGSRWGLRGSEDLGGGLKAVFTLESGFGIDEGVTQQGQAGTANVSGVTPTVANVTPTVPTTTQRLFGRQAFAGLEGGFGSIRLGRQYTPLGNVADLVGTKTYDVLSVAGTYAANAAYRTDNAITYKTPSFGGFTVEAQYSTQLNGAETNTGASPKQGRHFGINAVYANGPITAGLGYLQLADVNAAAPAAAVGTAPAIVGAPGEQKRNAILAMAGYDLGMAKITGYYSQEELGTGLAKNPSDTKILGLQAAFPFGAFTVTPGFAVAKDLAGSNSGATAAQDDAKFLTLQTTYDLSKRTSLYAFLTYVDNDTGIAKGFNSPVADDSSNGIALGVRHRF